MAWISVIATAALLFPAPPTGVAAAPEQPAHVARTSDADLLAFRETVWRDYFRDPEALAAVLTDDFVAFGPSGGPRENRTEAVSGSRNFVASGGKLVSLEFPVTLIQHYGDVAIVYSEYRWVLMENGVNQPPVAGRATEIFVWRDGSWIHPGWHLDQGSR